MTSREDAAREALSLLASMHVCTLATCSDRGPHAASLLYAYDGFLLYWFSDPNSRHSQHIAARGGARVTVTVAADYEDFEEIRGLQMAGIARRLTEPDAINAAMARLMSRYPFLKRFQKGPSALTDAMSKAAVYSFRPDEVTLIDNTKGFGTKIVFVPDSAE